MNSLEKYAAKKALGKGLLARLKQGKHKLLDLIYGEMPSAAKGAGKGALIGGGIGALGLGGLAKATGAGTGGSLAAGGAGGILGALMGAAAGGAKGTSAAARRSALLAKHKGMLERLGKKGKKLYRKGKHYAPAAAGGALGGVALANYMDKKDKKSKKEKK